MINESGFMVAKIIIIAIVLIILVLALLVVRFFLKMKNEGLCPVCYLQQYKRPNKITMDVGKYPDYDNSTAKTPPMGWSSWNTFKNHIDEDMLLETANAMVDSGLKDAGYEYLNIDDCWQSSLRDADGKLQGDLVTFSHGMPQLIKSVNALGLKVGLYSSNGTLTCEDLPASLGNEDLDAKTLASWGCEYFKYDFCHNETITGICPVIEKIEVKEIDNKYNQFVTFKPSDAVLTGRAEVIDFRDFHSGKGIAYLNNGAGTATFTTPNLTAGEYVLTVVHQKMVKKKGQPQGGYAQIDVNGTVYEMFFPFGYGWNDSSRTQIKVNLKMGENVITISNPIVTKADAAFIQYKRMGDALKSATKAWASFTGTQEKPIVYSICEWGTNTPCDWGKKAGNMWRTTPDIQPKWESIVSLYEKTIDSYNASQPGNWNDPDMLEVGNGKLTKDENTAHFSLWCMMASPLMLGNDVRKFAMDKNDPILKIVTNKQLIEIDQDRLGKAAKRIKKSAKLDIIARPLYNGDVALCVLNKSKKEQDVQLDLATTLSDGYLNFKTYNTYEIHDIWNGEISQDNEIYARLPMHSVAVYRIKAVL